MTEIWRKLEDFSNYEVSSLGRVRNIKTGRILKLFVRNDGYHHVGLYLNGKQKYQLIHRLVAITFIPNPENKREVNHIDGDKTNNRVSNLEWSTRSENVSHAFRTGLNSGKPKQKVLCVETGQVFESLNQVAKYLGVNSGSIHQAIRKRWRCGGLHFELIS